MRPGLGESIEPSGADGGNVGARPGVEPCSGGLELVELGRIGSNWGELTGIVKCATEKILYTYLGYCASSYTRSRFLACSSSSA